MLYIRYGTIVFYSQCAFDCNESDFQLWSVRLARRDALKPEAGCDKHLADSRCALLRRPADKFISNATDKRNQRNVCHQPDRQTDLSNPENENGIKYTEQQHCC